MSEGANSLSFSEKKRKKASEINYMSVKTFNEAIFNFFVRCSRHDDIVRM